MIVTDINGCTDSIIHSIIVNPIPVVAFTADTACFGNPNTFTDFSTSNGATLVSWSWNFGDGIGTSASQNNTYEYQNWGLFPASLTVSDNIGCTATLIHQVLVDSLPIPEFTFTNACSGSLTDFFDASLPNGSSLSSWYWDFGDQYYSSLQDPSHFFTNQGTFNVTIHVTNARGCSDSITHPITINPLLVAEFSADTVCFGFATQFTDWLINPGTSVSTWAWDFGDGTTSNIHNPTHVYTNAGIHTVVLTVTDAQGCTDIVIHQILVNSSPTANFSSTSVILGNATSFTDLSTPTASPIVGWSWNFGDGATSNVQNPSHTYALPGTYNATLIITDANGCKDTIVLPVIVNPFIIAAFTFDIVCEGNATQFTDNSSIASGSIIGWNWNFGDGTTSIAQNPIHVYNIGGTYTATLIVTGNSGGTDTIQHVITVYPKPNANFSAVSVCINDVTNFTDLSTIPNGSIVSWYWNFDDGNTSNLQNPSHTYILSGMFNVMLIVTSDQGCKDTVFIGVRVHANPVVDFNADPREGCEPLFVNFIDISTVTGGIISNWLWDFGDGQTSIAPQNAGHTYDTNGSYDVTLTVTSNYGCVATATIIDMILVHPNPIAGFYASPSSSSQLEPILTFVDLSTGASQWIWNFGDGHGSSVQSPHHEFADTGYYNVTQYVYNVYGCMDTASQTVHIRPEYSFYIPNTFTPNGNGMNDHFFPKGTQFENTDNIMYIFDRWGEMIFETNDLNTGWDGTYKGNKVQVGVYVWRIIATDLEGNKYDYMGHVNVIR
jgi:gliding motility-associated-like protein